MYDDLFTKMNNIDKQVRNNLTQYKRIAFEYIPNSSQQNIIDHDLQIAKERINRFPRFENTHFQIILFKDQMIENGFPHTMYDSIMLPNQYYFSLTQKKRVILLIHEFIHIYQRTHPFEFNHFLINTLGLKIDAFLYSYHYKSNKRLNPDLNNLLYDVAGSHSIMLYEQNAKSLSDCYVHTRASQKSTKKHLYESTVNKYKNSFNIQSEHPFETLACIFSHIIFGDVGETNNDELNKWLRR